MGPEMMRREEPSRVGDLTNQSFGEQERDVSMSMRLELGLGLGLELRLRVDEGFAVAMARPGLGAVGRMLG